MTYWLSFLVTTILNWLAKQFAGFLAKKEIEDNIEEKNAELRKENEDAQTKEERDKAATDIINNF